MARTVGLTYDLKTDYELTKDEPADANAEFDHPQTIDLIAQAIESLGYRVKRIGNASSLLKALEHLDVDIVFNISEGLSGRNRESQIPVMLEMKGIPLLTNARSQPTTHTGRSKSRLSDLPRTG